MSTIDNTVDQIVADFNASVNTEKVLADFNASLDDVGARLKEDIDASLRTVEPPTFAERHPIMVGLAGIAGLMFLVVASATAGARLGQRVANIGNSDPL